MIYLSLFGGMECGRIALDRMGITPTKYYSSEVDKFAVAEVKANYPDVIHLGDVTKWRTWRIDWANIDYLIGGSPCQGFSFAGKGLAFDDPRSKLFFEFVNILAFINFYKKTLGKPPVKFMLENVVMKRQYLDVIDDYLDVTSEYINSALVCAQNRQRHYWANWQIPQPKDRHIYLSDILETDGVGVLKNHGEWKIKDDKSNCIDANYHKGVDNHAQRTMVAFRVNDNSRVAGVSENERGYRPYRDEKKSGISELGRIVKPSAKTDSLTTGHVPKLALNDDIDNLYYRKLSVVECCRLQGVPDDYFKVSSNTQAYKMLGNGWQVDTIIHIFEQDVTYE